jgi:hypothetical protein
LKSTVKNESGGLAVPKVIVLLLTLAFLPGLTAWAAPEPVEKSSDKEDLAAAIKTGIEMLNAKKYTDFLERYMLPDDLAKFKKSGDFENIAADFKAHADVMVKILKGVQELKPELSEEGAVATYDVSKLEGEHPDKIQFRRVKDVWYIADK